MMTKILQQLSDNNPTDKVFYGVPQIFLGVVLLNLAIVYGVSSLLLGIDMLTSIGIALVPTSLLWGYGAFKHLRDPSWFQPFNKEEVQDG